MTFIFTYKQYVSNYNRGGLIIRKNQNQVGGEPYRRPTRIYPK